jgi:hypothetical protein
MVEQLGNIRVAAYELQVQHLFVSRAKVSAIYLSCYHNGEVDPYSLTRWGRYERLGKVEQKLKCGKCGMRGFCRLRIESIE